MKTEKGPQTRRKNGGNFEEVMKRALSEISLNLKEIEEDGVKQREKIDVIRRRRRVSAPATSFRGLKTPEKELESDLSKQTRAQSTLLISPSLDSVKEEDDENEAENVLEDEVTEDDTNTEQKGNVDLPKRRRVSAPAKTSTETAETTTFKQLRKEIGRKLSRTRSDPTFSTLPWLEWIEEEPEPDFEPVEFNLDFLEELIKG